MKKKHYAISAFGFERFAVVKEKSTVAKTYIAIEKAIEKEFEAQKATIMTSVFKEAPLLTSLKVALIRGNITDVYAFNLNEIRCY